MKFIRRISIFILYSMTLFGCGFVTNLLAQDFFYPGEQCKDENTIYENVSEPAVETGYTKEPIITADTRYVVISYDVLSNNIQENEEETPASYIGYDRRALEAALRSYGKSPSLTDLEKGFSGVELLSFSTDKVVIQKSYEKQESGYYLINENHNVVVYDKELKYMYMNTGIKTKDLPKKVQEEILHMKFIPGETELYHFLESYSS